MPRNAILYLAEMKNACEFLIKQSETMTFAEYEQNEMARLAVERSFITIGEAVRQLNAHHPALGATFTEKAGMIALRNFIVHEYWLVDDEAVWSTIATRVRPLKAVVEQTLMDLR